MSLDGYIAGPKGEADWIVMDPDIDFESMFSRYDTMLMGRKSYEAAQGQGGGGGMSGMPVFVFSRTLRQDDCRGVTVSDDPKKTVTELKAQPGKDIWLFGGGELFGSFLRMGLVDSVEIAVIPVLLGRGIPMVSGLDVHTRLKLARHVLYRGFILLEYDVLKAKEHGREPVLSSIAK